MENLVFHDKQFCQIYQIYTAILKKYHSLDLIGKDNDWQLLECINFIKTLTPTKADSGSPRLDLSVLTELYIVKK